MKPFLPVIVAVALMLAFAYIARPESPKTDSPDFLAGSEETEVVVEGLLGVIDGVSTDRSFFSLLLPDGGVEEIIVPEKDAVSEDQVGMLAEVSGIRDFSSRRITAEHVLIQNEENILLTSPTEGSTVTSPLVVFGFARVPSESFEFRLAEADGSLVREGTVFTNVGEEDQFSPFRFEIFLPAFSSDEFVLEVFTRSPRDGSQQDTTALRLHLLSAKNATFDVYFKEARASGCDDVSPFARSVSQTSATARAAILELLAGTTPADRDAGVSSALPVSLKLQNLSISDGEARVDFSAELGNISRSCTQEGAIAQITQTLLQFPSVQDVTITSEGSEIFSTK